MQADAFSQRQDWLDDDERRAYMEATVEQDIAWQIRINRVKRGMDQKSLAKHLGTGQSAISRLEDPAYGRATIPTLVKVAHAFDCALLVRLIPYSELARITSDTTEDALYAAPFEQEKHLLTGAAR